MVLATVVQTWGSAPRPHGAWAAIRDDGRLIGSVSGGCVEDDLIHRLEHDFLPADLPQNVLYGVSREEAARFGLPCGGTLRLVVEPHPELRVLQSLLDRTKAKKLTARVLDMGSGKSSLHDADHDAAPLFDGLVMRTIHGPRWRLILIGAGQLSQLVAQIAVGADYEVIVVDPREEFSSTFDIPAVTVAHGMPDDTVIALQVDAHTAIVGLTHDPKLDDMALIEALKSPAFYVGALGSRINTEKRRERLLEFDLTRAQVNRLQGPTGLFIGSRTPAEMAISILAEITAAKYQIPVLQRRSIPLHGRLVLRGNEPFVYPVVFDDTGGVWALEGISRPDAAKLQNHIVRVTATVTSEDASRPAAQVQSISVDDSR
ncbi:XdhC family protein [Paraburkholderia metrosideri]|uniref:XdhC family protein n=1 Tax=Paraburkholderia metrosideri TaxID=580937 RepID=UPI001F321B06